MRQQKFRARRRDRALVVACSVLTAWAEPPEIAPPPHAHLARAVGRHLRDGDDRQAADRLPGFHRPLARRGPHRQGDLAHLLHRVTPARPTMPLLAPAHVLLQRRVRGRRRPTSTSAAFGPRRRVRRGRQGRPSSPYQADRQHGTRCSIVTDSVFIDPTSTGYSRAEEGHPRRSCSTGWKRTRSRSGEFIRAYVEKFDRGKSPAFIAGESYGTTRAAALTSYLQGRGGVKLVGIMPWSRPYWTSPPSSRRRATTCRASCSCRRTPAAALAPWPRRSRERGEVTGGGGGVRARRLHRRAGRRGRNCRTTRRRRSRRRWRGTRACPRSMC